MQITTFLTYVLAIFGLSLPLTADDQRPSKPNVILMFVDDLGWQDVKCYDVDEPRYDQYSQEMCLKIKINIPSAKSIYISYKYHIFVYICVYNVYIYRYIIIYNSRFTMLFGLALKWL